MIPLPPRPMARSIARHAAALALGLALAACRSKPTAEKEPEPGTPVAPSPSALESELHPLTPEAIAQAVNPGGEKPYSGPIGGLRGVVRVSGPPAPDTPDLAPIPARCADARAFYGKVYREGPGRELADVLIAVTGYKGFLPAPADVKRVVAQGCAYESRTIGVVFGQRIEVFNKGGETFIPRLIGAKQAAYIVAVPGGDTVKLFPTRVGQYRLADATHAFVTADVFVLKFPTFAVTGIDGKFDLQGIPAGPVTISAYLPATKKTVSQTVNVVAGETASLELTIPFEPAAAPQPSASAH